MIGIVFAMVLAAIDPPSPAAPAPASVASAASTPADCSVVDGTEASRILGYPVEDPDAASRSGGSCFYISRDVTEDGSLSYAVVTADRLPQRRQYFQAFSRRCAPAVKGTLNELACRQYLALAQADDMDTYFSARLGAGDASPVPGLGDSAVASGNALYVRRGGTVFEVSVLRSGDFDLERSTQLVRELLERIKPN